LLRCEFALGKRWRKPKAVQMAPQKGEEKEAVVMAMVVRLCYLTVVTYSSGSWAQQSALKLYIHPR